jgi:hypothetical protein
MYLCFSGEEKRIPFYFCDVKMGEWATMEGSLQFCDRRCTFSAEEKWQFLFCRLGSLERRVE